MAKKCFKCSLHPCFPLSMWNVHNAQDTPLIVLPLPPRQPLASPPFARPLCSPGSQLSRLLSPPMLFIGWRLLWCRCGWFSSKSQSRLAVLMLSPPLSHAACLSLYLSLHLSLSTSLCLSLSFPLSHVALSLSLLSATPPQPADSSCRGRAPLHSPSVSLYHHQPLALPPSHPLGVSFPVSHMVIPILHPLPSSSSWISHSFAPFPVSFPFSPVSLSLALKLRHLHTL